MVYTVDSSNSPRFSTDVVNSPRRRKNSSSPKSQPVSGEAESTNSMPEQSNDSAAIESSETKKGNAGKGKKPAWNKPTPNGVAEIISSVMDASSWPALSESTKPSPKSSTAESSSKIVSDGSIPTSQGPVIANSPKKQGNSNAKSNSATNHTMPVRQRSMKRGGGGGSGSSSGGGHSQNSFTHPPAAPPPPPPPPFPLFPMPPNGFPNLAPAMPDSSPREPLYRGNNWDPRPVAGFVPQPAVVSNHRHSSRRANFGPPRGEVSHRNNFGGKRDQERGHYGSARDFHMQPQRAPPRGFVRPSPPNSGTFISPQPVRPFPNHMGFEMLLFPPPMPVENFMPLMHHGTSHPIMMPFPEPLSRSLVNQIEYYFSDINLSKDEFLKSKMDGEGWVPITLIASFNRVKIMTNDIQYILDCLRTSTFLEVQDDRVRRHGDWMNWLPSSTLPRADFGIQSPGVSSSDTLTTSFQKMAMEDVAAEQDSAAAKRYELTIQAEISHQEGAEGTLSS